MSCPRCFSGHVNPGSPTGRWEKVHGRKTYIAEPPGDKPPLGLIVIIPDAFGVGFINNQILADHYASAGQFLVYLPDFMDGNEAPVRTMINMAHMWDGKTSIFMKPYYIIAAMADFLPFLYRNRAGLCWPRITSFLNDVRTKSDSPLPLGIAGFCWGGLHAIKLSHDNADTRTAGGNPLADVIFTAHPSNANVAQDFGNVKRKLSMAIGDDDGVMPMKQVRMAQQILANKTDVKTEVVIYPGAKHGFSVRASKAVPDSQETRQAEEAEQQAVEWFRRHLVSVKH